MIGYRVRSHRHLKRLLQDGPKLIIMTPFDDKIIGLAYCKKETVYALTCNNGERYNQADIKRGMFQPFHQLIQDLGLNRQLEISATYTVLAPITILPNDFLESYQKFLRTNKKLIPHTSVLPRAIAWGLYSIIGDNHNFFQWGVKLIEQGVDLDTIRNILYWRDSYGQLTKLLSKKTITAYTTPHEVAQLMKEQMELRRWKRCKDTINRFNTAQKQILRANIPLHPSDKEALSKFEKLSLEKKINFIKKMSNVDSYEAIMESMKLLVRCHFMWSKESFMKFIKGIDRLKFDIIVNSGDTVLLKVYDYETVKYMGKATNWCITKNSLYWKNYVEFYGDRQQYIMFDFSKPEDDPASIVGFTIKDGDGIIMAHDYFNRNLMIENPLPYFPVNSHCKDESLPPITIYSLLGANHILNACLLGRKEWSFEWNAESICKFVNETAPHIPVVYHRSADGASLAIVAADQYAVQLYDLFFDADSSRACLQSSPQEFFMFFDFTRSIDDPNCIVYFIANYANPHVNVVQGFNCFHKPFPNQYLLNCLLLIHNMSQNRPLTLSDYGKMWASAIMCLNTRAMDTFIDDEAKWKCALRYIDPVDVAYHIMDDMSTYLCFDVIEYLYNHGKRLSKIVGIPHSAMILAALTERFKAHLTLHTDSVNCEPTSEDIEAFLHHKCDNQPCAELYGLWYGIKMMLAHEPIHTPTFLKEFIPQIRWDMRPSIMGNRLIQDIIKVIKPRIQKLTKNIEIPPCFNVNN